MPGWLCKSITFVFFCISSVTSSSAQSASPAALVDDFVKAWNSHDGNAFARIFTDDATFVPLAEVRVEGRSEIVKGLTELHMNQWAKTTTVHPSAIEVRTLRPDVAVVLFHLGLTGILDEQGKERAGQDRAMVVVAVKQPDGWRIAVSQMTKQSPPPDTPEPVQKRR